MIWPSKRSGVATLPTAEAAKPVAPGAAPAAAPARRAEGCADAN